jgi:hypothetical protein
VKVDKLDREEKTILDAQSELEAALQHLASLVAQLPDELKPLAKLAPRNGMRAQVSFRYAKKERRVSKSLPAARWVPDSGLVAISYIAAASDETLALDTPARAPTKSSPAAAADIAEDPARDIVMTLAKAELDPQLGFVSLKWFRDTYLPQRGYSWAASADERQRALVNAIERRWILTSRVANPKNPQFPVTAIKVNRPLAEVRRILDQEPAFRSAFDPIAITGEPLSQTVLRERR